MGMLRQRLRGKLDILLIILSYAGIHLRSSQNPKTLDTMLKADSEHKDVASERVLRQKCFEAPTEEVEPNADLLFPLVSHFISTFRDFGLILS